VARLLRDSESVALRKVGEEATEVVIAGMSGNASQLVRETADLWFHSLVALARFGRCGREVLEELERRFGTSGLAEKAERPVR
jgi:phosphoribosyl-ATP pyrophosphohydrolase